jgi:hypothetical protein
VRHQLSLGITSSADCGVSPALLDVYRDLDARDGLPSRVNVMPLRRVDGVRDPLPLPEQHMSSTMLRVDTVKFLADGGLIYLFLALMKTSSVGLGARFAGVIGLVTTAIGLGASFLPTADVTSVMMFEAKMVVGVVGPTAVGWYLFKRAQRGAPALMARPG